MDREIEDESVYLRAVVELIDSMVNHEMLSVLAEDPESEIRFHSSVHQRLFNVLLVDFLSQTDKRAPTAQLSYLGALRQFSAKPNFSSGGDSSGAMRSAVQTFVDWLEQEVEADCWLPTLNIDVAITIDRVTFIKMCGNLSKHNFLRSVGVASGLQKYLAAAGCDLPIKAALLALPHFYERFHVDILNYHSSTIVESLNDVRWGIYRYLQPELSRSIVRDPSDPLKYRYDYPAGLESEFARTCYWDLLNSIQSPPAVRQFKVTRFLKLRY